ncbi:hypothetical protein TNCV_4690191 [Trichonephila clavipes]|nr:hypothetical protein TNCV_4690191 [Trichonephila clavipes]
MYSAFAAWVYSKQPSNHKSSRVVSQHLNYLYPADRKVSRAVPTLISYFKVPHARDDLTQWSDSNTGSLLHAKTLDDAPTQSNGLSIRLTSRFVWTLSHLLSPIKFPINEHGNVVLTQPFTSGLNSALFYHSCDPDNRTFFKTTHKIIINTSLCII